MCIYRYNGLEGTHIKVTEFVRDKDCLVCGPGTLIELDTSSTLAEVSIANPSQAEENSDCWSNFLFLGLPY